MITQSGILTRKGWSKSLIKKLLGEPDLRKKVSGHTHPLCLYQLDRVQTIELSDAFHEYQDILNRHRFASTKAVQTKTNKLMAEVANMVVTVKSLPIFKIQHFAIDAYNDFHDEYDNGFASSKSDKTFLKRITVNYIRHQLTQYDFTLEEVAGRTGIDKAVDAIRKKVFTEISNTYPQYREECERQIRRQTSWKH